MAKKQFGKELRRSSVKKEKKPLDISAAESVHKEKSQAPKEEVKVPKEKEIKQEVPVVPKQTVHRTSINFPYEVYDAMLEHTFRRRITMKDYLVDLIRKDLDI